MCDARAQRTGYGDHEPARHRGERGRREDMEDDGARELRTRQVKRTIVPPSPRFTNPNSG